MNHQNTPLVLLILDGWGVDVAHPYNAIEVATTPQWDSWWKTMPHGLLHASGEAVGLPKGQIGNSEVGHMHIGAGRLIPQDLTRINQAIKENRFEENKVLQSLLQTSASSHTLHVMGLLSPGGVHSHEDHLFAFLSFCMKKGLSQLALHLFLDGRDVPPQSAMGSLLKLEQVLKQYPVGRIASICGRYYAMDRDARWDRVSRAYNLITQGEAEESFQDASEALNYYYAKQCYDEFIPPTVIGKPLEMHDGDSIFLFNYRADRMRELTQALVEPHFTGFDRKKIFHFQQKVTMTTYQEGLPVQVLFPQLEMKHPLGEILATHGLKQLRLAETEKYAHVTFFLNGGSEAVYPGEDRILIPSPKVATYDLQPEMAARAITDKLLAVIASRAYDVILCNYANADMVGHTGVMEAAVEAVTCLDHCMAEVGEAVKLAGGVLLIVADHGNAEVMYDEAIHQPHTAHTNHLVPFLFVGEGFKYRGGVGSLSDVAPTILALLGLPQPIEMTGQSLLLSTAHDKKQPL